LVLIDMVVTCIRRTLLDWLARPARWADQPRSLFWAGWAGWARLARPGWLGHGWAGWPGWLGTPSQANQANHANQANQVRPAVVKEINIIIYIMLHTIPNTTTNGPLAPKEPVKDS